MQYFIKYFTFLALFEIVNISKSSVRYIHVDVGLFIVSMFSCIFIFNSCHSTEKTQAIERLHNFYKTKPTT